MMDLRRIAMLKKLLSILVATTLASAVFAQGDDLRPVQGDKTIGIGGQWMRANDSDIFDIELKVDYMVNPQVRVAGDLLYFGFDGEDSIGIAALGQYLLNKEGATLPYVQLGGMYYSQDDEDGFAFVLGAGVDHFISANQAFYLDFKAFKPDQFDEWVYLTTIGFKVKF